MSIEGDRIWTKGPAQKVREELELTHRSCGREAIAAFHLGILVDNVMRGEAAKILHESLPDNGLNPALVWAGLETYEVPGYRKPDNDMADRAQAMLDQLGSYTPELRLTELEARNYMAVLYPSKNG